MEAAKGKAYPGIEINLSSIGQLDDEGWAFNSFPWWKMEGQQRSYDLAYGQKIDTLYMMTSNKDTIDVANTGTDAKLWHLRLGQMSKKGVKVLLSKGKLLVLKSVESDLCKGCILGKQNKVSFIKVGKAPKPGKLELVHTNLWGPTPMTSLEGSQYYIMVIDDSSKKVWF